MFHVRYGLSNSNLERTTSSNHSSFKHKMSCIEEFPKISSYFTQQTCLKIISENFHLKDVKITKTVLGGTSKKGDSYLSNICKFTLNATGKTVTGLLEPVESHVIVKYLLENIGRRKTFRSADFFENEAIFYREVWPALQDFQDSKNCNNFFQNIPRLLSAHIDGLNDYIALQDLSFDSYKSVNRGDGLDYDHTMLILKLFANFHGLSLSFKDQQPEKFKAVAAKLKETYFHEKFRNWYEKFQSSLIIIVKDAVKKELPEHYLDELENFLTNGDFYGRICELCGNDGKLSVITHGDAWIPNFLIKYENDAPVEGVIIDFQLARYASLSNDLIFFLYSCVQQNLLVDSWDEFIGFYHKCLCDTLEKYGSPRNLICLKELEDDIKNSIVFGIGMSIEALTMSLLDDEEVNDLDSIQGDEAVPLENVWIVKPFKDQMKRQRIASIIKHAVDKTFF